MGQVATATAAPPLRWSATRSAQRRTLIAAALGWMLDAFDVQLYSLVVAVVFHSSAEIVITRCVGRSSAGRPARRLGTKSGPSRRVGDRQVAWDRRKRSSRTLSSDEVRVLQGRANQPVSELDRSSYKSVEYP